MNPSCYHLPKTSRKIISPEKGFKDITDRHGWLSGLFFITIELK